MRKCGGLNFRTSIDALFLAILGMRSSPTAIPNPNFNRDSDPSPNTNPAFFDEAHHANFSKLFRAKVLALVVSIPGLSHATFAAINIRPQTQTAATLTMFLTSTRAITLTLNSDTDTNLPRSIFEARGVHG